MKTILVTGADNRRVHDALGFVPRVHWTTAVRAQMAEMAITGVTRLAMARPLPT